MKANYDVWNTFNEFTIRTAGYLWVGEEPGQKERNPSAEHMVDRITDAWRKGEIQKGVRDARGPVHVGGGHYINGGAIYISRDSLKQWAEQVGFKPQFLFPDEIKEAFKGEKFKALLGLAILAIINSNKSSCRYGSPEKPTVDAIASLLIEQSDRLQKKDDELSNKGFSKRTVTTYLNESLELIGVKTPKQN